MYLVFDPQAASHDEMISPLGTRMVTFKNTQVHRKAAIEIPDAYAQALITNRPDFYRPATEQEIAEVRPAPRPEQSAE